MFSPPHAILLQPAKFCSNPTTGVGVMTSYRFFKMAAYSRKCTSGFRFSHGICLRRWKSICLPNFDEIFQFTAEIKLLPVSENCRPPFWNSISSFDFYRKYSHRHVILHLPAKLRSNRTIGGGVMMSYRFFKMAAIRVGNVLPGSGLLTGSDHICVNLFACQIWMRYLNPRMR